MITLNKIKVKLNFIKVLSGEKLKVTQVTTDKILDRYAHFSAKRVLMCVDFVA